MKFVELHVQSSGQPISINPDAIAQIGMSPENTGYILRIDGGSVSVSESYQELLAKLS